MLRYHKSSIERALLDLFPNIGLEVSGFMKDGHKGVEKSKIAFAKYAKARAFDASDPENWYAQPRQSIMSIKVYAPSSPPSPSLSLSPLLNFNLIVQGVWDLIAFHKSLANALTASYPNIGLKRSKLSKLWNR